ncbi:hypothetical protein CEP53_003367 [Fusarium sp. AF-6]|nr:hypothetical protein CEP53_003367 [Fusarium sp. AF-6]
MVIFPPIIVFASMEDTCTYSQASSESPSTYIKPHEDQTSTTTESTSLLQNPPSMLTEASELSRLDQLPPELRRSILATLDLNHSKALIKSCPTFHQQFRHDRRFILGSVLNKELGLLAVDAYAVHLTSPAKFNHAHLEDTFRCNLFGSTKHNLDEVHILDMFFGLYGPWEVEEIKGVHDFAVEGLDTGLDWLFDNTNSRIVASDGFYFHVGYDSKHQAAQGEPGRNKLEVKFHRVEMLPSSSTQLTALYTSLFNTIDECEHNFDDHLLGKVLGEETQNERRIIYPSARDERERDQKPLPFKGDDPALPPVAWAQTWRGTYSNLFGAFMPDRHAEWGLMMWDEPRFRNLQGYEVVWYTCKDEWGSEDPREIQGSGRRRP